MNARIVSKLSQFVLKVAAEPTGVKGRLKMGQRQLIQHCRTACCRLVMSSIESSLRRSVPAVSRLKSQAVYSPNPLRYRFPKHTDPA